MCPAPSGSTLTFEFREWPSAEHPGSIDSGHKGPCSVYIKKMDDIMATSAAGPGWFKIWEDGYDTASKTWCVDRLIAAKGLLSVDLPTGLPAGYYLVRPEVLALHHAYRGSPEFYTSCAQIYIGDGPEGELYIPKDHEATIPGYVNAKTPGVDFDIYKEPMAPYVIPGPKLYLPTAPKRKIVTGKARQQVGVIPQECKLTNANWCGKTIASYNGEDACWKAASACWAQGKQCWATAPASGGENCEVWDKYCQTVDDACSARRFEGPPKFTAKEKFAPVPGSIPKPWNNNFPKVDIGGNLSTTMAVAISTAFTTPATTTEIVVTTSTVQSKFGPSTISDPNDDGDDDEEEDGCSG